MYNVKIPNDLEDLIWSKYIRLYLCREAFRPFGCKQKIVCDNSWEEKKKKKKMGEEGRSRRRCAQVSPLGSVAILTPMEEKVCC